MNRFTDLIGFDFDGIEPNPNTALRREASWAKRKAAERVDGHPDQPRDHGRFASSEGTKSEAPEHWDHTTDGPLYHVTYAKHLASIAANGLDPNYGGGGKGIGANAGYTEHSKHSVFVTEKEGVGFWQGKLEDHANDRSDDTMKDKLTPVTLRIHQSPEVFHDEHGTRDSNANAMMVREKIDPKNIEFFANNGWHPIAEHSSVDHKSAYTTDEDGTHWLKPDHENPFTAHFDAFEACCDVMTRFDYSEDQARDAHGRFGSSALGLETNAKGDRVADAQAKIKDGTKEKTYWEKEDDKQAAHLAALASLSALSSPTVVSKEPTTLGSKEDMGKLRDEMHVMHEGQIGQLPGVHDDRNYFPSEHEAFETPERTAVLEHLKSLVEDKSGIAQKYPVAELRIAEISGARGTFAAAHNEQYGQAIERSPGRITITPEQHMKAMAALGVLNSSMPGLKPKEDQISGLHTYVHEMCHTTSPMQLESKPVTQGGWGASGYQGHGAIIEEVTTEVMARDVMSKLLAATPERETIYSVHSQIVGPRAATPSSYQPAINWTMQKVATSIAERSTRTGQLSIAAAKAPQILHDAALAYRNERPAQPFTANQAAAKFAEHLGHAAVVAHPNAGMHEGEIAESLRLQFRQVASGEDADILQRFDAETMSRFDAPQRSVWTVPRNDIAAAMAITNPSPDEMSVLLMLQDNPELLLQALAKRSP